MRPQLIGVDLDGTLLDGRRSIPAAHRRWVAWCAERDIRVVIVTGRPLATAIWPWQELGMTDPLVCFNGVWIGIPGDRVIEHHPLGEASVREILQVLCDYDGMISTYPEADSWVVDRLTPLTRHWPETYEVGISVDPQRIADWHGESSKVMFVAEPPVIEAVLPELTDRLGDRFHVVASEPDRIEIHDPLRTKGWGLARLAEHWEIPAERVWAVGDADNDIEMISWAARGFAMDGASPGLQAVADGLLPSARDGGLASLVAQIESA